MWPAYSRLHKQRTHPRTRLHLPRPFCQHLHKCLKHLVPQYLRLHLAYHSPRNSLPRLSSGPALRCLHRAGRKLPPRDWARVSRFGYRFPICRKGFRGVGATAKRREARSASTQCKTGRFACGVRRITGDESREGKWREIGVQSVLKIIT